MVVNPTDPEKAKLQVQREVSQQKSRWPEIRVLVAGMRQLRIENHVGEKIRLALEAER